VEHHRDEQHHRAACYAAVALWLGVSAVRRRDIGAHRAWMMRAYALGMGAGTQVFTHVPLMIAPSLRSELSRAIAMGTGWAINALVAEFFIQRSVHPEAAGNQRMPASRRPAAVP
jgi:hypothetical protein